MGFASFMQNPKAYLGHHRAMVQDAPPSAQASVAGNNHALPNGKTRLKFTQSPNHFITMIHTVGHGQAVHSSKWTTVKAVTGLSGRIYRSFQPITSNVDIGFRYLPFKQNFCTYMTLDANATFFITGPLTGCTVGAVRQNGAVWVFHSNDNVNTGMAARNIQRTSIQQVCTHYGITFANVRFCEYLTDYHGFGFVFGRRRGGGVWKFYAHATDDNNNTRTQKWGEV